MRLLQYKDLNLRRVKAAFDKVKAAIEADAQALFEEFRGVIRAQPQGPLSLGRQGCSEEARTRRP